jgi:hypothetical protein
MSDIAIRLDGLLLAAAIALTALLFAGLFVVALIMSAVQRERRARRISLAKGALLLAAVSAAALAALAIYLDCAPAPTSPVDWIDWLIVPWLGVALAAAVRLAQFSRAAR